MPTRIFVRTPGSSASFGSAASLDAGTGAGEVLLLAEDQKLPALNSEQLTGVPGDVQTAIAALQALFDSHVAELAVDNVHGIVDWGGGGGGGGPANTDFLAEGVTNLYFTDVRAVSALASITDALSAAIAGVGVDVSSLEGTVASLSSDVGTLQTTVGSLSSTVTGLSSDVGTLQTTVGSLSTTVGSLSSTVTSLSSDVGTLQTTVTSLSSDVGTLQTTVTSLSSDVGTLQTTVTSLSSDVGTLQTTVTSLSSDVGTLQTTVGSLSSTVTGLSATVDTVQLDLSNLQTSVNMSFTTLSASVDSHTTQLANLASVKTVRPSVQGTDGTDIVLAAQNSVLPIELEFGGRLVGNNTTKKLSLGAVGLRQAPYTADANTRWTSDGASSSQALFSVIANRLYHIPCTRGVRTSIATAGFIVTTAVAGNARIGFFARDPFNSNVGELVVDFGTLSLPASTGLKELTGLLASLDAGCYYMSFVMDVAPQIRGCAAGDWTTSLGVQASSTNLMFNQFLYRSFTYGALPSTEVGQTQTVQTSGVVPLPLFS